MAATWAQGSTRPPTPMVSKSIMLGQQRLMFHGRTIRSGTPNSGSSESSPFPFGRLGSKLRCPTGTPDGTEPHGGHLRSA